MDFSYSEEQSLLRRTLQDFLENTSQDPDSVWKGFVQMGLVSAPFPRKDGGHGTGAVETMIVMEAVGRYGLRVPYLSSVVLAGGFVRRMNPRPRDLPDLISGKDIWTFGWAGETRLEDGVLRGRKVVVREAPRAKKFLVTAHSPQGLCVCLVPAEAPGVRVEPCKMVDGVAAATLIFEDTPAEVVAGEAVCETVMDEGRAALCAEAAGAMRTLYEKTLAHCQTRRQFGKVLGDFQVLQHRLADMFMICEEAFSMACLATLRLEAKPQARAHGVCAALAYVSGAGRRLGEEAIQLHGAIAMSDDLDLGRYVKRLFALGSELGDRDSQVQRFMRSYPSEAI